MADDEVRVSYTVKEALAATEERLLKAIGRVGAKVDKQNGRIEKIEGKTQEHDERFASMQGRDRVIHALVGVGSAVLASVITALILGAFG